MNRGPAQEYARGAVQALQSLARTATPAQPGDRAFNNPAFGQNKEFVLIAAPDDLKVDLTIDSFQSGLELGSLIAAIGIEFSRNG